MNQTPSPFGPAWDAMAGVLVAAPLCLLLAGCGSAKVSGHRELGGSPTTKPALIYVTDFELGAQDIRTETGLLPPPPRPPGPLGAILPKPPGASKEPAVRARELVELMSASLVEELGKAGLTARRLRPGEPRPTSGWLVRGIFTQVDEGDRVRRAVVGFGAGQTQMQVVATVDDLARGIPRPFYEVDTRADSGKAPGAGPMIVLAPAAAAARSVLSGGELERNVEQAAAKIAADLAARVRDAR